MTKLSNGPNVAAFKAAQEFGFGNCSIAFAHTHPMNDLSIMKHLESPIGHGRSSRDYSPESLPDLGYRVRDAFGFFPKNGATRWLDFGDHEVASFGRSAGGSISAITIWHYITDQ